MTEKGKVVDYIVKHTPYSRARVMFTLEPLIYSYAGRPYSFNDLVDRVVLFASVPELDIKEENGIYRMVIQTNK